METTRQDAPGWAISIRDDVTDPAQVGVAFDAEGTPKRRVDLVHNGVTGAVLQTRRTAAKAGTKSTGSAVPGAEGWGALPANVVLEAGERSIDELLAGVGRGLLVTEFHYTRILDPRTTVVTGLTRNGVWLIEDGRSQRIGSDLMLVPNSLDDAILVPALHLASWNFTGGAKG